MKVNYKKAWIILAVIILLAGLIYWMLSIGRNQENRTFEQIIKSEAKEYEKMHEKRQVRVTKNEAIEIAKRKFIATGYLKYIVNTRAEVFYNEGKIQKDKDGPLAWRVDFSLKDKKGITGGYIFVINALSGNVNSTGIGIPYNFGK